MFAAYETSYIFSINPGIDQKLTSGVTISKPTSVKVNEVTGGDTVGEAPKVNKKPQLSADVRDNVGPRQVPTQHVFEMQQFRGMYCECKYRV